MKGTSSRNHGGMLGGKDVSGLREQQRRRTQQDGYLCVQEGSTENPLTVQRGYGGNVGGAQVPAVGRGLNPENPLDQASSLCCCPFCRWVSSRFQGHMTHLGTSALGTQTPRSGEPGSVSHRKFTNTCWASSECQALSQALVSSHA